MNETKKQIQEIITILKENLKNYDEVLDKEDLKEIEKSFYKLGYKHCVEALEMNLKFKNLN